MQTDMQWPLCRSSCLSFARQNPYLNLSECLMESFGRTLMRNDQADAGILEKKLFRLFKRTRPPKVCIIQL